MPWHALSTLLATAYLILTKTISKNNGVVNKSGNDQEMIGSLDQELSGDPQITILYCAVGSRREKNALDCSWPMWERHQIGK